MTNAKKDAAIQTQYHWPTVQWNGEYMRIPLHLPPPHPFAKWEPNCNQIGFDPHGM